MNSSLQVQTISSMVWSFISRFGAMILSFVANLVLARLLTPEDFGIIGIIMVFIAVSNTLIDSGFSSALIQKSNPTKEDYSTIFYWNIILSIFLYFILFLTAPTIANFYKEPILTPILRIQGIALMTNSLTLIHNTILVKQLSFKKLAKINLLANLIGATLGITLAIYDWGVWSLVIKYLIIFFINSALLFILVNWRPQFHFSFKSFRSLFKYGSFILLSSVVERLYLDAISLIIGRVFSTKDLGYYTQAKRLENVPTNTLSTVVNQVTFPVFSRLQDDLNKMKYGVKKSLKAITYINFPLMTLLVVIGQPLILFLFTDKWTESVPYFQLLCLAGMLLTLNTTNTNVIKAVGRSDLFLIVQTTKRIIGLIFILIGIKFGILGMLWGIVIANYMFFIINAYVSGKLIGYGIIEQIKDLYVSFLLSIFSAAFSAYILPVFIEEIVLLVISQIVTFGVIYIGISYSFKLEALDTYTSIISNFINNVKHSQNS